MAIAKNGASNAIAATDAVTSQAFVVAVGGTLLSGTATMLAGFAILSPNATPITVTSVTDSAGNTWTKVTEQASGSGWNTSVINAGVQKGSTLSIWQTKNATINTSITITANFSSTTLNCIGLFTPKFTGADTTQPLDQNASLPKVLKQTTLAHPDLTGISTDTSHLWPVSFASAFSSNILTSIIAFNGVSADNSASLQHNNSPNAEFLKAQTFNGPAAASAYSNVSFTATSNMQNVWHIGLVLTADTQTPPVPTGPYQSQVNINM